MLQAIRTWWPLLLGVLAVQLGNGLQATSVGLRIDAAGFSPVALATVMSGMYVGGVVASVIGPRYVAWMRHVPAYVTLVLLGALAPAAFLVREDVVFWTLARFAFGFALSGIFIVVESWLNDCVANAMRGRVFAIYILVQLGGLMVAQFLVPLFAGHVDAAMLVVIGFALLAIPPVVLGRAPRPSVRPYVPASLPALVAASPVGVAGAAVSGFVWAVVMAMSPIYAQRSGFAPEAIAFFVAAAVFGGLLLQAPIGWLSDIRDRRVVLCGMSALACLAALCGTLVGGSTLGATIAVLAVGGLTFPYYSVAVAHVNDRVEPAQRVAASGAMILLFGLGSVAGPAVASAAMEAAGPAGFFGLLAAVTGLYALYVLYRLALGRPSAAGEAA